MPFTPKSVETATETWKTKRSHICCIRFPSIIQLLERTLGTIMNTNKKESESSPEHLREPAEVTNDVFDVQPVVLATLSIDYVEVTTRQTR